MEPTEAQADRMFRHCADARYVWNLCLEQSNLYRPTFGPTPRFQPQLAEARKGTWLGEGSSSVQQVAIRDFEQAMRNWWGGSHGRPTWRKRGRSDGFAIRDLTVAKLSRHWATVNVPKCGPVRFRLSRPIPPDAKSARATCDSSGRWHVAFTSGQPEFHREATGLRVGLDMGIANAVTTSDGEHVAAPTRLTRGETQRKRRLQRQLARQTMGSNRRNRTKRKIARLAAREAGRRNDWIERTTTDLVRRYDFVAYEDLKVANMVRSAAGTIESPGVNVAQKRGLNRSISAQSWARFRTRIEQKAAAATSPVTTIAVNPKNTSRNCSACSHLSPNNRKSQAVFMCENCGHKEHADVNAGNNILAAGLAVTGRGGTPCRSGPKNRQPKPKPALTCAA